MCIRFGIIFDAHVKIYMRKYICNFCQIIIFALCSIAAVANSNCSRQRTDTHMHNIQTSTFEFHLFVLFSVISSHLRMDTYDTRSNGYIWYTHFIHFHLSTHTHYMCCIRAEELNFLKMNFLHVFSPNERLLKHVFVIYFPKKNSLQNFKKFQ